METIILSFKELFLLFLIVDISMKIYLIIKPLKDWLIDVSQGILNILFDSSQFDLSYFKSKVMTRLIERIYISFPFLSYTLLWIVLCVLFYSIEGLSIWQNIK